MEDGRSIRSVVIPDFAVGCTTRVVSSFIVAINDEFRKASGGAATQGSLSEHPPSGPHATDFWDRCTPQLTTRRVRKDQVLRLLTGCEIANHSVDSRKSCPIGTRADHEVCVKCCSAKTHFSPHDQNASEMNTAPNSFQRSHTCTPLFDTCTAG